MENSDHLFFLSQNLISFGLSIYAWHGVSFALPHDGVSYSCNYWGFALELHEVHTTSKGEFVVIGILYKIGLPDRFLSKVCS
ncbi:hypothetical protein JHK85_056526 [Glycine max]|nr:hypothetical protein JHK85_056526 [Glycine max]